MQVPGGNSVYERWVNSLRAWAKDPENVSLLELPVLEESTFTPDTYRRLVSHILDAMRQANERWHQGLTRAWTNATTPYELSREMVSLRTTLARRVQLARHPGLPEPIQAALLSGLRADIERYQQEAETAVRTQRSAVSVDATWSDQMLAVVREHSFMAVLDYDVSGHRPLAAPLADRAASAPIAQGRRSTFRRIVPFTSSQEVPRG